jgi:integrase/recombinase XerD
MTIPKTAIILDTRRIKKDNTYPVKLRMTFERKQKYYSTPFDLSDKEFEKVMFGKRLTDSEKILKKSIGAFENKAIDIIEKLHFFTWHEFEKKYFDNRRSKDILKTAFENRIDQLRIGGQIGTAITYECSKNSLNKFYPQARFLDFSSDVLKEYEKYMLENGKSKTTVSIYLRALRSIYNEAISKNDILPILYPFRKNQYEKDKYEIPISNNIKKALDKSDIQKIFKFKTKKGSIRDKAKDYWIFIYLTNGLNVKDLCLLQYKNIKNENLEFVRAKTKRQKREKKIQAVLLPDTIRIIKKWGNNKNDLDTFLFPELNGKESPLRQKQLIQQLTHVINDNMKSIASELKITKPVTTYAARHSFATVLKRSGASVALISEMLGHSSLNTTQKYLDSFQNDTLKKTTTALTSF